MLLTFNVLETPYNTCIHGKAAQKVVYKYRDRPVICHKCYYYYYGGTKNYVVKQKFAVIAPETTTQLTTAKI